MTWIWRYRMRLFLHNSVWVLPSLAMIAALIAVPVTHKAERFFGWESYASPDTARTVLITLACSMFTLIVFVASAMLLALQLASAQLTPRIVAILFRDPAFKYVSVLFVFTFTFALAVVARINESVQPFTTRLSAYLCVLSLGVFFYLIDHVGRLLRPSEAMRAVAREGRQVIESVYPHGLSLAHVDSAEPHKPPNGNAIAVVLTDADGVLLACDVPGLVAWAEHRNCVIEMVPQIGNFVGAGSPLFRIFGQEACLSSNGLSRMVAIGSERTLEQDPAFVFRVIVDIACKALSPAINDPTTAVIAIDQLHHLLRTVGQRSLDDERIHDARGRVRLIYRTPGWEDFVRLAVTEIRQYGCGSIQVARRLRAMLEDLIQTLPEDRLPLLHRELDLLHRSASRFFPEAEDRALAAVSDLQGVGGKAETEGGENGSVLHEAPGR